MNQEMDSKKVFEKLKMKIIISNICENYYLKIKKL